MIVKVLQDFFKESCAYISFFQTRLKINLGSMPHLAAGLELELQAKNVELKQLVPEKAIKVK